jgi:toxin CcdB
MPRFDVRANLHKASRARVPLLLEVQADLLAALGTRLVVPLVPSSEYGPPAARLNPVFRVGPRNYVMDTAAMAAVPTKVLGATTTSLAGHSAEILDAIDFLVSGV